MKWQCTPACRGALTGSARLLVALLVLASLAALVFVAEVAALLATALAFLLLLVPAVMILLVLAAAVLLVAFTFIVGHLLSPLFDAEASSKEELGPRNVPVVTFRDQPALTNDTGWTRFECTVGKLQAGRSGRLQLSEIITLSPQTEQRTMTQDRKSIFYPHQLEEMCEELRQGDYPGETDIHREHRALDVLAKRLEDQTSALADKSAND